MEKYIIIGSAGVLGVLVIVGIVLFLWKRRHRKKGRLPVIKQLAPGYLSDYMAGNDASGSSNGRNKKEGELWNQNSGLKTGAAAAPVSKKAFLIDRQNNMQLMLVKSTIVIGADGSKADFWIQNNRNVSGQHAILYQKNNKYYITDNHSTNHTYVNEVLLMPGDIRELSGGEYIRVANITLEFMIK